MTEDRWEHEDWIRLGIGVKEARATMGFTQEEFVPYVNQLVGSRVISTSTLRKIENAKQTSFDPRTLPAVSRALNWGPYGYEEILDGADPRRMLTTDSTMPAHAGDIDHLDLTGVPEEVRRQVLEIVDEHRRKQE